MSGQQDALVPLERVADGHALLRGLFEHAPVPYAIYSREGRFLLANPAYRRMFAIEPPPGYSLFEDELVAALGLLPAIQRGLGGEVVDTGVFWYDPNALAHVEVHGANRVAIACTAFPLRAASGEVSQLAIAYRDVTAELIARDEAAALAAELRGTLERFEAQHLTLQRSEAELRATFELAAVGMAQIDARTGRFLRVNQRLCELTGYDAETLERMTFSDLTHPDDRARDFHEFACMVNGQHPAYQIEKRCVRRDGEVLWLQVTGAVVQDGREPSRSIAMHVDVSARRRSEDQTKTIADNATTPLLLLDARQHCVFMNPAAEQMTGYTLPEVQGKSMHAFVHHTRPDGSHYPIEECPIDRALPERRRSQGEDVFVHRDGHFYPVAFAASPLLDASGVARGTVVEVRDTTQEKRAQMERDRLLAELEQAVRVRDDFLSIAGHEVRTPLTALMLNLQALVRAPSNDPELACPPRLLARLQKTLENAERLQQLTEELLDVSRIASGRLRLASEQLDLVGLVRSVVTRLTEQALKEGSPVCVTMGDSVWGAWDRFRVEQLVSNLLTNALKYGAGKPVEVSLREEDGCAVLCVRDGGIGIAHDDQARIFERFERAVSNRHYGGLGLGLWIARQVVEASNGTIAVESTPGQGTSFTVRLPTSAARPRASDAV
ncbi:MAG: PAS domain S-box protein [Polyangiales bacterium]